MVFRVNLYANSAKMVERSVLHCLGCYDTMAKYFKAKIGFCENEKGLLGYSGFRGSIVQVLTFCDFAKRIMRQRWVVGHGYYFIHFASVCKCFWGWT